ncbi:MAG: c-type cytochrome biogenesis protein CcmI [Amphiplicatus sp.]
MIWMIIAALSLGVLAFLAWPLFRLRSSLEAIDETDYLSAQLLDVERDRKAGVLSEEDAGAADLEARRRLLSAARAESKNKTGAASPGLKQLAVLLVGAVPAGAVALYLGLGNPALEETKLAQSLVLASKASEGATGLSQAVSALEARLADDPGDVRSWTELAQNYAALDRFAESAAAFARAAMLSPNEAFLHAALGEALIMANGGAVNAEASAALKKALELDPKESRARFYAAIGLYQSGDRRAALDALVALANEAPDDAPWLAILNREVAGVADELNIPAEETGLSPRALTRLSAAPQRGPSADDIAAAEALTEEQRASMIAGMVEKLAARLEDNPDDLQGWTMLARSYASLGENAKSIGAFEKAIALSPDDLELRISHAQALLARGEAQGAPIDAETKTALDEVLKRNAEQPFALFFLGVAARQADDAAGAKTYWGKLLAQLPPDSDEAARVKAMMEAL